MAKLRDYDWAISYSTSNVRPTSAPVDILREFYIPVLERSTRYDRVAGYFSSSSLAAASRGFSRFVAKNGRARFIVGAELDQDDVEAIVAGDEKRLERSLAQALEDEESWPEQVRRGVELLTWMVAQGYLEIRIAIRVDGRTGQAKTLEFQGDGYVHEKWAIFEAMWSHRHPHIKTYALPEAIEQKLIRIVKRVWKPVEVDDDDDGVLDDHLLPEAKERLRFVLIRLAPLLPGGEFVGMETAPVEPWPHQWFAARRLIETYPDSHLLCDEVGLGKTIEAGLAFRSLWLAGRAKSIRVFAPAALTIQWMHEMAEKPGNGPAKCIIRQTLSTYRQPVVSLLDFGVEQQRITPNIDTEAAAVLYLGAIQGLVVQSMVGGDIRPLEQLAPHIFRLLSASFQEIPDDSKK